LHRLDERVAVEPNIPCGDCPQCSRGLGRICARKQTIGQTRWGGLAEYVSVPQAFAWRIPDSMPLADAATIEPAAVAMHVISRAEAGEGSVVAIVGCGGIGLMVAAAALASGYRVVAIELNEHRRNAALSAGVERLSDARDAAAAHEFFVEAGVTVIIECGGLAATAQLCLDAAPRGSRIVLVGLATGDVTLNPLRFVRAELDVRGALIYDHPADFASTIDLVVAGRLSPGRNTATPAPLRELPAIFAAMETGTFRAKPLISPQIST
jgi:threonine dehydrogenase-like Zn-dependent dehydrogenase